MKIAYVTTYNALDIHNWSGLGYTIAKALADQGNSIDYIGNLKKKVSPMLLAKSKLYKKVTGKSLDIDRHPRVVQGYSDQITSLLNSKNDVIFSPGTVPIALLETKLPKVFYTDATFAGILNFYDKFQNLSQQAIENGNYIEKQALESSQLAIYSSDWAAQTAIEHYAVHPSKVKVVPFGANLETDRDLQTIKGIVSARSTQECHLLFLGVDWERKGGDVAVSVADLLNKAGLKTTLHIAGAKNVVGGALPDFVVDHGFISKSTDAGRAKLDQLFAQSNFLLLPTKADCTPVVFSEANSFGLPCITTDVGGIQTIIKDDTNGKTFSLTSDESLYADYIYRTFSDPEKYRQLALSSFHEYSSRLNWTVAGRELKKLLNEL